MPGKRGNKNQSIKKTLIILRDCLNRKYKVSPGSKRSKGSINFGNDDLLGLPQVKGNHGATLPQKVTTLKTIDGIA